MKMGSKSRRKGADFERETVNIFKAHGIAAERRAGLQASAITEDQGDVYAAGVGKVECKRRARGFSLLYEALANADCAVVRDDRSPPLIVFDLQRWLEREASS